MLIPRFLRGPRIIWKPRNGVKEDHSLTTATLRSCNPKQQEFSMSPHTDTTSTEKKFRGWRLLGFILCVVVVLALVSAIVDWMVIGPLEGRAF